MLHAVTFAVIVNLARPLVFKSFPGAIRRRRDSGMAVATANNIHVKEVRCHPFYARLLHSAHLRRAAMYR